MLIIVYLTRGMSVPRGQWSIDEGVLFCNHFRRKTEKEVARDGIGSRPGKIGM
jgi:hypothetical protein